MDHEAQQWVQENQWDTITVFQATMRVWLQKHQVEQRTERDEEVKLIKDKNWREEE